jgi:4-hydroxyproline epimerase
MSVENPKFAAEGQQMDLTRIRVIDSHTGGEPTRVVVEGGPKLGRVSMLEARRLLHEKYDGMRSAVVNEPRGSDVMVGAMLFEPLDPSCVAGVVFFNNVGYLNMCGHGTIGLAVTLAHMGRIREGKHKLETPVGIVEFEYRGGSSVAFENVPSYRYRTKVAVDVPGIGKVVGDIAWGGNWFFLIAEHGQSLEFSNIEQLTDYTWRVRQELIRNKITGENDGEIDHIELFGPPKDSANQSRNFVLCPGKAYDRSPCGTGTSAKIACLAADGKLREGETWRQESIIGSVFEGSYRRDGEQIIPRIVGSAYLMAEATLILDSNDPFRIGIRA